MAKLMSTYYPQVRLHMIYRSLDRIGNGFRVKDRIHKDCMSCLIYQYKCESCCALYIGKTEQQCRISQHQEKSDRTGSILQVPVQSDIRIHCLKHKQHVNSDNFTILDQINFSSDLCTLESLYQKPLKPTIVIQSQSTPLIMFP